MKNIFLLLLICGFYGLAQELPEIIYPSPTAAALGEYGNTPISLSTGTPNINIPIWEIKGKKINLPISLSYRASGIKVEEHGSQVGLGWTLNAGGMVTRVVKDKVDFGTNIHGMSPQRAPWIDTQFFSDNFGRNGFYPNGETDLVKTLKNINGYKDKSPDIFYYNFLNYSGKYIFDDAGNPMVSPDINFKIEYLASKITDTNGTIYSFSLYESDSGSSAITGWYLTKIESADLTEWIDLEYTSERNTTLVNKRGALLINYMSQGPASSVPWYNAPTSLSYRICKITSSFGETVTFNAGENREDLYGTSLLSEGLKPKTIGNIDISYLGNCIKKIDFDYEFVESDTPGYVDTWWSTSGNRDLTWANKRLYLKGLKETTCNNDDVKAYVLEYYGRTTDNKDLLPSKLSYAQDHWGYFNGKILNQSYIPTFQGIIPGNKLSNYQDHYITVTGADRTPSYPHMEYGTLKSITYPTGGETEFIFEQHQNIKGARYLPHSNLNANAGGLRIAEVNDKIDDAIVKSKKYTYSEGSYADYPYYGDSDLVYVTESYDAESEQLHHYMHPALGYVNSSNTPLADPLQYIKMNSGSSIALGTTNGYHLSYEYVKEKETGNGSVSHRFTSANGFGLRELVNDDIDVTVNFREKPQHLRLWYTETDKYSWDTYSHKWPFVSAIDQSWKRGLPIHKAYFSEENDLIKYISYEYDFKELKGVKRKVRYNTSNEIEEYLDTTIPTPMYNAVVIYNFYNMAYLTGGSNNINSGTAETLYFQNTKVSMGVALKSKETVVENGNTTITDYTYNDQNQLATTSFTNSQNQVIVSENKYPQDFAASNNVYEKMVDANVLNPNIEQKTKKGTNTLSVLKSNFHEWGTNLFAPHIIQTSKGTNTTLDDRLEYSYYTNGNVKEVSKTDGTHIYYMWGYNEQYPIAKIENATFFEVETAIGTLDPSYNTQSEIRGLSNLDKDRTVDPRDNNGNIISYIGNEGILREALNALRNSLPNSMVTTYTFDPVIGITSITDPKGYTMYYEYDDFNRLKQVKDAAGKIISHNEYHYEGQSN